MERHDQGSDEWVVTLVYNLNGVVRYWDREKMSPKIETDLPRYLRCLFREDDGGWVPVSGPRVWVELGKQS